jgi:hypothetical protein
VASGAGLEPGVPRKCTRNVGQVSRRERLSSRLGKSQHTLNATTG